MSMRSIMNLESVLCLHPGHPAIHGLLRKLPALSCSFITPRNRNVSSLYSHKNYYPAHISMQKYGLCQQFTTLTSSQSCLRMTGGCRPSLGLPGLMKYPPSALMVQLDHKATIHQQQPNGDKQLERHFILTPKGLFHASPESWKPYLSLIRLDRPIGSWLLFLPCAWSISLAAPAGCLPDATMLALFAMGSFFMRGAGCTINDMWDKDFDARVTRTKDRPLACGQITQFNALVFLGLQLSAALAILLTMNWNTVMLGATAMIPVIIYPLMKRVTYWPQIFLGITLNWGVMIAWSGLHGSLELPGAILYVSCALWTIIYDTIYSHQDKDDDILIGVKSTALTLGDRTKPWLLGFGSMMVGGLTASGMMCDQTWPYFLGVSGIAAHLLYQIVSVDLNNGEDCSRKFRSNRNLGIMFWAAIVMANLLKGKTTDKDAENTQQQLSW